jgi:uncharacterized RDD family membrane protein YckC
MDAEATVAPAPGGSASSHVYAGFWWRVLASLVDALITSLLAIAIALLLSLSAMTATGAGDAHARVEDIESFVGFVGGLLYFAIFESTRLRATPGKLLFGLRVVDLHGQQISLGRALGRNLGKYLSTLLLGIGFMMAGWTRRKQALHDMMAGCLVVRHSSRATPIPVPST